MGAQAADRSDLALAVPALRFCDTMSDEEHDFDQGDAGSAHTFPQQCGELRKGSYVMIKGHPCKVAEITTSKTGKHGHAKAHIVAIDIFTSKKYEDLCPCGHNIEVPFVKRTELQVLTAEESGEVSLLLENGETKDDLFLPDKVKIGEPTDDDKKLAKEIVEVVEKGDKTVLVAVLEACGMEKIVGVKTAD